MGLGFAALNGACAGYSGMRCKTKIKSGSRCTRQAGDNGFCAQHDPRTLEEKNRAVRDLEHQKERLQEVLDIMERTCELTSWGFQVDSCDQMSWRYATVGVRKYVGNEPISH